MQRVSYGELEYSPADARYYYRGEPFTGLAYGEYGPGRPASEQAFRDGLEWGPGRCWYESGGLMREGEWSAGVRHGRLREWHESGRPAVEAEYLHGICVARTEWGEGGELVGEFRLPEGHPRLAEARRRAAEFGADASAAADPAR